MGDKFLSGLLKAAPQAPSSNGEGDGGGGGTPADEEAASQAVASQSLALAVCSALCRAPANASSDGMLERLPLFAQAAAQHGRYEALPKEAVVDALEVGDRCKVDP